MSFVTPECPAEDILRQKQEKIGCHEGWSRGLKVPTIPFATQEKGPMRQN